MTELPCPTFLEPRLRLFLSADIVGSTALKQTRGPIDVNNIKRHYEWFSAIQGFYIEARRAFLTNWGAAVEEWPDSPDCFGDPPRLWKTIGDEVLFEKVLTDHRQLAVTLQCWISAVGQMRDFVKSRGQNLDVKCAAWLAGFPIRNKEVVLSYAATLDGADIPDYNRASGELLNSYYQDGEDSEVSIDYVGPSIDIGFRIATHATPRKFVLSVGIPYILSMTSPTQEGLIGSFPLFYGGSYSLKGVLGGVNYPIFWIDMSSKDSVAYHEDRLTGARSADRDDIRRFCDAFYDENSLYTHRPFINADGERQVTLKPEWWDALHSNLVKNFHLPDVSDGEEPPDVNLGEDKPVADDQWAAALRALGQLLQTISEPRDRGGEPPEETQ